MANVQAITKTEFAKKSWKRHPDWFFSKKDAICPLGITELPPAMMGMPLAFVSTDREYSVVAVQGLKPGTNFFVNAEGRWRGSYIPAAYRGYPFVLGNNTPEESEPILCFDTDSGLLFDDDSEEPFFDEGLEPTQSIINISNFLSDATASRQTSMRICNTISEHGLLKPWELEYELENETKQIDGLFCIDEAALNELTGDAYAELRVSGAIPVIYCQLLSMQQIVNLTQFPQEHPEAGFLRQADELNFDGVNADGNISFENL